MPSSLVKRVTEVSDMSKSEVEELWEKAKKRAEDQGHEEEWDYIVGIFKQSLGKDLMKKLNKKFDWEWPERWAASIVSSAVSENILNSMEY